MSGHKVKKLLRAIAGNASYINCFHSFHTVCCMYGLSNYEIKRICQHARFSLSHMEVSSI